MLSISTIDEEKNQYLLSASYFISNIESFHNSMSMWLSLFYG